MHRTEIPPASEVLQQYNDVNSVYADRKDNQSIEYL